MVKLACEIAVVGERTPYAWAAKHEEFAQKMAAAENEGAKVLLNEVKTEVRRRGIYGWDDPIVYKGKIQKVKDPQTGKMVAATVRRWSDLLLMYWGKYLDPRFRDSYPAFDLRFQGPSSVSIVLAGSADDVPDGKSQPDAIDITSRKPEEDSGMPNLREEE